MKETIEKALNKQINMELEAYYTYLGASAFFDEMGLKGFAEWMFHHAEEEMTHAMKIYHFVLSRRGSITLHTIPAPKQDWETAKDVVESAFAHEQKVTASINDIVELSRKEKDYATDSFMQWFVDEQVEEEEVVDDILQKLNLIGDFRPGLYLLDRELAAMPAEEEEAE
ncbi:MAG: ferritin [Chloroflexota bacterium]